ncbi:MAG: GAF domain-containing protein [Cyanobacteriota bacterium]|nr:GAF domain-containing protein [Cyanobacteriota bacterium]
MKGTNYGQNNQRQIGNYNGEYEGTVEMTAESMAIVPVERGLSVRELERENNSTPESEGGLRARNQAIAAEVEMLRSSIDARSDRLQALIEEEGAAAEKAEQLNKISARLQKASTAEELFSVAVDETRSILASDRLIIYQLDRNGRGKVAAESVEPGWPSVEKASRQSPPPVEQASRLLPVSPVEQASRLLPVSRLFPPIDRTKAIADIYHGDSTDSELDLLETLQVKACLMAPIRGSDRNLAILIAHQCGGVRHWSEAEIELFEGIALQLGCVLERALLLEKQQAATKQAQLLESIYSQLRRAVNRDDILAAAADATREAIMSDRVLVAEFDRQWKVTVVAESVDRQFPMALGAEIDDPCFRERYAVLYERGRFRAIDDIYKAGLTECHLKELEPFEVKASLIAPILVEKKLMGLLIAHQCSDARSWKESEIKLLRQVAMAVGYACDRTLILEEQQAIARQARLLNQITAMLREDLKPEEIFDVAVEESRESLNADRVLVYAFDPEWQGSVIAESVDRGWKAALGAKIADPCFADRYIKPYLRGRVSAINNIYEARLTECHIGQLEPYEVKSNLVAPIIVEKQLYGLLIVHQCSDFRTWKNSEIDFIKQLGTQIGFALDRINLLQKHQVATAQARRLNQISSRIRESLNPKDILNAAVEEMREATLSDRVIVYEFDERWQGTVTVESVAAGFPEALGAEITDPCFAENYAKQYLQGRVKATDDIARANLSECHLGQLEPFQVKASLVAPIIAEKKLIGLLIAHQCSEPRRWQEWEIDLAKQVAIQIGYALDQALLLQKQQAATQQARQLSAISSRVRESLDPDRICRSAVEGALELMAVDRAVIYRFDETTWDGEIISEAVKPGWATIVDMETDVPCFPAEYVEKYRLGRVQVAEDITKANLTECHQEQLKKWQVKANVVVPIVVNRKLYGLLGAHQCASIRQWQESEVEVFKQVAQQVGYALEQAWLLEQVELARQDAEMVSLERQQQKELLESSIDTFLGEIEGSFGGDLTVRARVTDGVMGTVADFFNATIENLQKLVLQVQSAAGVVTATAEGSEVDIKVLSGEAQRQAEAIAGALIQIKLMVDSIQGVADNAREAEVKAQQANKILKTSDGAMNKTVDGILAIQKTVDAAARKVKNLGDASKKISRVVSLISDLANQTNILALNASVEATRADRDDEGFATVAGEVRTLAEQSASATREIEQIVEDIQAETNEVVKAMIIGRKRVLMGTELVKGARKTLTELARASGKISELVEEIAQSAIAQADTSGELSDTMHEVAAIADKTSGQSLTVAQSFARLLEVAGELQKSVAQFKVE